MADDKLLLTDELEKKAWDEGAEAQLRKCSEAVHRVLDKYFAAAKKQSELAAAIGLQSVESDSKTAWNLWRLLEQAGFTKEG